MLSRNTLQKNIIKEEIMKFNSFFDAEQLYQKVLSRRKNIGIASIYRFLKKLVDEGKIHSYLCNRKTVYSFNIKNHCHFICENCGYVKHISIKKLDFLKNEIKKDICHFQIDITGICEKCRNKRL